MYKLLKIILRLYINNVMKQVKKNFFELYENVIEVNMIHINNLNKVDIAIKVFDLLLKKISEKILKLKLRIYLVLEKLRKT